MPTPPRVRRSPEEARRLILDTAGKRLAEFGIKGLNIKDIAADSGINHGTLLHHFGSAEGMRNALLVKLSEELINEMSMILTSGAPPAQLFMELFRLMSQTGQTKLLAWRALEDYGDVPASQPGPSEALIQQLLAGVTQKIQSHDEALARNIIFLALSSAIGWGICSPKLKHTLGMSADLQDQFPVWVGEQLPKLLDDS
ncbi:MAG: AcrR family transcriptional regulator [Cyclobacteriaceae bacterium]|jgi:AcrR family transcriptional regulator